MIDRGELKNIELKDLNWEMITKNKAITPEIILAHPEWPWKYKALNDNPNVNSNTVSKYTQIKWDFSDYDLTEKRTLSEKYIKFYRNIIPYGYIRKNIEKMITDGCCDYMRKYKCLSNSSVLFSDIEFLIEKNEKHGRYIKENSAVYIANRNFCYKDIYKMANGYPHCTLLEMLQRNIREFPNYDGYNSAVIIQRWWRKILKNRKKKRWFYFF